MRLAHFSRSGLKTPSLLDKFSLKLTLIVVASLALLATFHNLWFSSRVLPNTLFANIELSNKNFPEAEQLILAKVDSFENQPLVLTVNGQEIAVNALDLGVKVDRETSLQEMRLASKNDRWTLSGLFKKKRLVPRYSVDFEKLSSRLNSSIIKYDNSSSDAKIVFKGGKFLIEGEKAGQVVNRGYLFEDIRERVENLSNEPIQLLLVDESAKMKTPQVQKALERVTELAGQKIVLTSGRDKWEISENKLLDLLRFYPAGQEREYFLSVQFSMTPVFVKSFRLVDSGDPLLDLSLDRGSLREFVEEIAKTIDTATIDATLKFDGNRVTEFTPAVDGRKVDTNKTVDLILSKVSIENPSQEKSIVIALPVSIATAKIASEEINALGIKELVGRGVSYFAGSIPNRVHNLTLGSKRITGTLVKPGEVFSFNKTVGEVSGATGYKQAYVISKGRTILDDGGGICQVSTTVFRAALEAGLPILTRTAHAYRVAYYEQRGFKPGLDATVWSPAVDLQFKNDTDHHLLVQAIVNPVNSSLQIDVYGTRDGRRVAMTEPVVSNLKPPLPDKYEDDPTLPKGTVKQVDFSASGATAVFTRKVYKGDRLIIDDTFKSNFRPWQAIFLVGTGG